MNSPFDNHPSIEMDEMIRIVTPGCEARIAALPDGATREQIIEICPCFFQHGLFRCPEKKNAHNPIIREPFRK